ncbi:MAG: PAS domain S-box protein, partial [Nitrospinae bacterium]|nr:PAS domain S-box protein [Nitrospinota bacterium]
AIARDIRKRKEAEIQLVESQEKYNRFMDAESNAVLIIDGNTKRIMECNPAAPRLYGYEPQEFLNMNLKDLIADADPSNSNLSPASGLGSIQKATQVYQKRKDGTLFPANVTTNSFRLRDIDYELKIISNTSEHMEIEEQLKETREEFERYLETQGSHVDQITREKEEQRIALREEKLNTVKQITASMVDLVNNPIQGIEKILEQVKEKAKMEDVHKGLVTVAMNECRRVGELIGKLKNYQPPEPEDLEPLDVHQIIDEVLQSNMDTLNHRTITLEKEYAAGIPLIDGVTQQIRQAIHNIVKNAEESFTHDEGKITISTEQDGSHVIIHIKDNGCGIPEKDLDRIFDPFYTTKSALHRPGLGLLASLGIIKNHQGEIDVHSRPGEGTTFTVTLPFKQTKNPNNGQF